QHPIISSSEVTALQVRKSLVRIGSPACGAGTCVVLNAWGLMGIFLPGSLECPPDFVIAHGAPYVSAQTNNLVSRIAVSERPDNETRLLKTLWVAANSPVWLEHGS